MTDLVQAHDKLYPRQALIRAGIRELEEKLRDARRATAHYEQEAGAFTAAADVFAAQLDATMTALREAALAEEARAASLADDSASTYPFAAAARNTLDQALSDTAPVHIVPHYAAFAPLPPGTSRHRYLVAHDGLWLECRRPWLHLIWPLAEIGEPVKSAPSTSHHATPFGRLNPAIETAFGKVPHDLIRGFAERGRRSCPNERGAWLSWEHGIEGTAPRLAWSSPVDAEGTPGALQYDRPEHTEHLSPCIDIHTHGSAPAYFSPTDDQDDAHDVKIAIVLGNLDQPVPSIAARLCCLGVFIPVTVRAGEIFGGGGAT